MKYYDFVYQKVCTARTTRQVPCTLFQITNTIAIMRVYTSPWTCILHGICHLSGKKMSRLLWNPNFHKTAPFDPMPN